MRFSEATVARTWVVCCGMALAVFLAACGGSGPGESAAEPGPMRMLSEQTGGEALNPYEPDELGNILQRYLAMMTLPPQPTYIWDQGFFLFLLLLIAGFEWIARKLGGML